MKFNENRGRTNSAPSTITGKLIALLLASTSLISATCAFAQSESEQPTAQKPAQSPAQKPAQSPAQTPAQSPAQKPAQSPAQTPAQSPAQTPVQSPGSEASTKVQISNPTSTLPSATDPQIKTFNAAHLSWLPEANPRNELLVFLTGTNGKPYRSRFLETASKLGYHVISLMYPCSIAAQTACANSDDPDAYMKFRLEIIQGTDTSTEIDVPRADCIENRLAKLLVYLNNQQPGSGWDNYIESGEPKWGNIGFCGQSQGGGHAYVISKIHPVSRVIFFGSPKDYSFHFNAPAKGFDTDTKTPAKCYFGFNHMEDKQGNCDHKQQLAIFKQMGLTALGIADADHPTPSYNHAHLIFTDGQLPDMTQMPRIHNFAINNTTVLSANGKPICPPVWHYMLTEPVK